MSTECTMMQNPISLMTKPGEHNRYGSVAAANQDNFKLKYITVTFEPENNPPNTRIQHNRRRSDSFAQLRVKKHQHITTSN